MSSLIRSPQTIRHGMPVVLLAVIALAQISASAGVPVPGSAPPTPTVLMLDGGDHWVNGSEQDTLMVRVNYSTSFVPPITSASAKIVGTPKDTMTPCASGAPHNTPLLSSDVPQPGGFFLIGPFDVSSFPDGVVLCAVGFVRAGAQASATDTSNVAIKDTIGPVLGSVEMVETFIVDGYLNIREATNQCCIAANWSHADPGDVASTQVWFEDSTSTITGGCGVFNVGPSGFGAVNSTCAGSMAQGPFTFRGQWTDVAGNPSGIAVATLIKDTIRPNLTMDMPEAGAQLAPSALTEASGTADPGAPLVFRLNGDVIGNGTAAPDGTWTFSFTTPAALGNHTLLVTARDEASNFRSASRVFEVSDLVPIIILPVEDADENGTVTIYGNGRPASDVEVYEGDVLIGSVRVTADGFWTIISGMPDGPHAIRARGFDSSIPSTFSPPRNFSVDAGSPTVTITNEVPLPAPLDYALLPGVITGTATDGFDGVARIRVEYFNALGTRVLSEDASCPDCGAGATSVGWEHEPSLPLPGPYTVVAQAFDIQGNSSVRRTIKVVWA